MQTAQQLKTHYAEVRNRLFKTPTTACVKIPPRPISAPTPPPPQNVDPFAQKIAETRKRLAGCTDYLSKRRALLILPVLEAHDVTWQQVLSPSRNAKLVAARHEVMAELRDDGMSLPRIGAALGGKDHTTVLHGIRKVKGAQYAAGWRMGAETDHGGVDA